MKIAHTDFTKSSFVTSPPRSSRALDAGAGSAMRDVASFDAGATFAAAPAARSMESAMRVRVID